MRISAHGMRARRGRWRFTGDGRDPYELLKRERRRRPWRLLIAQQRFNGLTQHRGFGGSPPTSEASHLSIIDLHLLGYPRIRESGNG